ncbi:hypothetical protein K8Z61_08760 [Nocardioides sp. TRM66260-LWL]|uniref:hypothetical protein n=1 Tax=Nocardioides sp. TRM66260-LWL TaxID=2874478 RepID=UPI001CC81F48|nr:hypothetical protein [Nocardioides sp. TRM66260-LWL]MBZ5734588.1 hypothetical protein [Nocardioides sp. TRM66260-LWL]
MNRLTRVTLAVGATLVAPLLATPTTAHAEVPPSVSYDLILHSKVKDLTDYKHRLGICKAESNGIQCTISKGRTATRSIGVGLNVSKGFVAGELNISKSTDVTVSVGCDTVTLRKGQALVAYPVGSRHKYKIRKTTRWAGGGIAREYSRWHYTFNPYRTSIACKIINF